MGRCNPGPLPGPPLPQAPIGSLPLHCRTLVTSLTTHLGLCAKQTTASERARQHQTTSCHSQRGQGARAPGRASATPGHLFLVCTPQLAHPSASVDLGDAPPPSHRRRPSSHPGKKLRVHLGGNLTLMGSRAGSGSSLPRAADAGTAAEWRAAAWRLVLCLGQRGDRRANGEPERGPVEARPCPSPPPPPPPMRVCPSTRPCEPITWPTAPVQRGRPWWLCVLLLLPCYCP